MKKNPNNSVSRRDFLKLSGVGIAGLAGAAGLRGLTPGAEQPAGHHPPPNNKKKHTSTTNPKWLWEP